jgi:hypothetical protein
VDLNRKLNESAKVMQAFNNIRKRGKVIFGDECAVYRSCQSGNVMFWSKENLNYSYFEEFEHNPSHVVIWAWVENKRLYGPYFFGSP